MLILKLLEYQFCHDLLILRIGGYGHGQGNPKNQVVLSVYVRKLQCSEQALRQKEYWTFSSVFEQYSNIDDFIYLHRCCTFLQDRMKHQQEGHLKGMSLL